MKISLRILFSILLAGCLFGAPTALMAEDEAEKTLTGFSNVALDIRAEFDDPYNLGGNLLLVILEGDISTNQPAEDVPVDVSFIVPSNVVMYSAGYRDASGVYRKGYDYDGPPERQDSGIPGWDIITITMEGDTFVIEYYDPDIITTTGDTNRNISYQFRWLYPIINLNVLIQAPEGAKKFTVEPEGQLSTFEDYESYFYQIKNIPFNSLAEQEPIEFDIGYSFDGGVNPLLITGIIIGAFVIITVAYFRFRSSGDTRAERRRRMKQQPVRRAPAPPKGAAAPRFCRHCGKKLERPSKFCPYCGEAI